MAVRMGEGALDEDRVRGAARRYETTLDRAGLALAAGAGLCALVTLLLVLASGERDMLALVSLALLGGAVGIAAIAAIALPPWLVLHRLGWRREWHAATLGAGLALTLFVAGQTDAFAASLLLRWLSALATSLLLALVAAGIALVMWRIAYRRS